MIVPIALSLGIGRDLDIQTTIRKDDLIKNQNSHSETEFCQLVEKFTDTKYVEWQTIRVETLHSETYFAKKMFVFPSDIFDFFPRLKSFSHGNFNFTKIS